MMSEARKNFWLWTSFISLQIVVYMQSPTLNSWASLVAQQERICLQCRRGGFDPWVGKIPGRRRKWQPTPVFLPGKSRGQRSLEGYSPWNSPGQNTGVGCLSLLQGIFPTQGSNPGLPHCRRILYHLSHRGSPRILEWVAYPFCNRSS